MKLKYYLRGLGIGIIVTAIILTISNAGRQKETLTDEEIMERAAELGMILPESDGSGESGTGTQDGENTEGSDESGADEGSDAGESGAGSSGSGTGDDAGDASQDNGTGAGVSGSDVGDGSQGEGDEADASGGGASDNDDTSAGDEAEIGGDASSHAGGTSVASGESGAEDGTDAEDDAENGSDAEDASGHAIGTSVVGESNGVPLSGGNTSGTGVSEADGEYRTIVVVSGEYSDRISQKLQDAGLIDDAEEFNRYLMEHDMDDILTAGTHQIQSGASWDEIARQLCARAGN